jgi:membrane-associated protein
MVEDYDPMGFIHGLHGAVAIVLLCSLLFAEEAGVPLLFAPGELVLVAAGLLVATGGLDPFVFVPLAAASAEAGALVGFSWARLVGTRGLEHLAQRLRQAARFQRVTRRVRSAGPREIAVSRLIPGLRVYTTLVAGALGVERRTFLLGITPVTIAWVAFFTALGALVGAPAVRYLGALQNLAVEGSILVAIGTGAYLVVRRVPAASRAGLVQVPVPIRVLLALAVDLGIVASLVTGVAAVFRRLLGAGAVNSWVDAVVLVAVVIVAYLVLTRRSTGATAGEALLGTNLPRHRPGLQRQ